MKVREYLEKLKSAVKEEGCDQEPLLMAGFVRQMELLINAIEEDLVKK